MLFLTHDFNNIQVAHEINYQRSLGNTGFKPPQQNYAPQNPQQNYAPQNPQQNYAPQNPQSGYGAQQPQNFAPQPNYAKPNYPQPTPAPQQAYAYPPQAGGAR